MSVASPAGGPRAPTEQSGDSPSVKPRNGAPELSSDRGGSHV
jgi:hypothetical protein